MATATFTVSNIRQRVNVDGKREVSATLKVNATNRDYVTGGLVLSTVQTDDASPTSILGKLGLKQVDDMYVSASRSVAAPYTQAQWVTAQGTTHTVFLDNATSGTPQAPRLLVYAGGAQAPASALATTFEFRAHFIGS